MSESIMKNIEASAEAYAGRRAMLVDLVGALEDELRAVRKKHLKGIRGAVGRATERRQLLHDLVDSHRELFKKPRSRILHGIKLGLQKGKGKVTFEDADKVVQLIEKHLADQAELLIATEKKPVKSALLQLAEADLKRIGCKKTNPGDVVLIQPADSEVDKLVDALLASQPEETEE